MSDQKIRNMEDFAAASGISRPTVSKYFNDPSSVRSSTRTKIEVALEKYSYRPNIYAINQNRRSTKNIGIVVPYLADPFFTEIVRNVERIVIAAGYRPILMSSHGDRDLEIENLEALRAIRPGGVLMAPLGRRSDRSAIEAFCSEVSTVLFDSNLEGAGEAFVGSNNDQSIGLIVEYLCRTGEPPSFFEMRQPPNPNAMKRRKAYIESMERIGHEPHLLQVEGESWDFEEIGFNGASELIANRGLPTNTLLCSNDRLAIGAMSAAYEAGLRVGMGEGSALRVAGHDDHPFARFTCPTLTTVSQDYISIAEKSAATILGLIEMEESPENRDSTLFDGRLIMRSSA